MPAVRLVIRNYTRTGLNVSFDLVAIDENGAVDTAYTGAVAFSAVSPVNAAIPGLPANYVFTANDRGVRSFNTTIATIENVQISATPGGGVAAATIYIGGGGPDSFTGGAGGDVFDPNGGTNTVTGAGGEDSFVVTGGSNTVDGGANTDRLVIIGGDGISNTVALTGSLATGYSGTIAGGGLSAAFQGIENFSITTGNNSGDSITTGDGDDEFTQIALDSSTYIRDVVNLGGGTDRVIYDARNTGGGASLLALSFDGSGELGLYGNGKLGFTGVEQLTMLGGSGADALRGLDAADRLEGNAGNDRIAGNGGDDDLRGGAGADVIDGDGRPTILLVADNLNNAGASTSDNDFRVNANYTAANPFEADVFTGTTVGPVRLRIRGIDVETGETAEVYVNNSLVGTLAQFASGATGDTVLTFDSALVAGGVARVRIQNTGTGTDGFIVQDVELTVEKTGNDRLDGGAGVDQLAGGRGNDVYIVDDGDAVHERSGEGTDTVFSQGRGFTLGAHVETLAAVPSTFAQATAETSVNTTLPGNQFVKSVTDLADGGYVITWYEPANGGDARARVYNADGSARSAEIQVNSVTSGNQGQFGLSAVALNGGGFLVAFFSTGGSGGEQVLGRVFDANGVAQAVEYTLTDVGVQDSYPVMARLNSGQVALISQNGVPDGNGTFAITYRLLNADGSVAPGTPVVFNTTTPGDQIAPNVAKLDDGRVIVVWESAEAGGPFYRARFIDANGQPVGTDFAISTATGVGTNSAFVRSAVTAVNGGGFVVTWEAEGEIAGRVFDSAGVPLGLQFVVNERTADLQDRPTITRLAEGGFMVAWTTYGNVDGDNLTVMGRLFNADGTPRGGDFIVNQTTAGQQADVELAKLADGRVVVAFSGAAADGLDVRQIILDTTPTQLLTGNELANSITGGFGDDVIAGSGGGDTLTGNQGADVIYGGDFTTAFNGNYTGTGNNLIVNGSFETQDGTNDARAYTIANNDGVFDGVYYDGVTSLFGWQRGTGFLVEFNTNNTSTIFTAADGATNVNLEYLGGQNQILFQDVAGLAAGERYVLRFAASFFPSTTTYSATLQVVWNGLVIDTVTPETKSPGFYTYIVQAAATGIGAGGANRLEFREIASGDGIGTTLDAISLQTLAAAPDMGVGALGPNLIANGSFEQRDATTTARDYTLAGSTDFNGGEPVYRFSNELLNWGFTPGTTRIEFNTDNPTNPRNEFQTGDGLVALDLSVGGEAENFGIFQDVAGLAAGQRYRITLSAALPIGPDQTAAIQVIWNGRVVGTVTPTSFTPTDYSFDVFAQATGAGAGGANRIAFQEIGANGGSARGTVLDNIRLNLVNAADAGPDTVDYARESGTGAVIVNLSATSQTVGGTPFAAGTARDSFGSIDRLVSIENVTTGVGADTVYGSDGANVITTGTGADTVVAGGGDDVFNVNVSTDGGDTVDLGTGADRVLLSGASGQIRLTFTSAGVGNGAPLDTDNGLNVRLQAEDGADGLTGAQSRYDDEGITFIAGTGQTFDVRDFVSGAQRGDQFRQVDLGTSGNDVIAPGITANAYVNAGGGNDTITTGAGNDFLVGGAGDDTLNGGTGNDSLLGGAGNDTVNVNVTTDGADTVDLGADADRVLLSGAAGQIRVTFTSAGVGNGAANDTNGDLGLNVRLQAEDGADGLAGALSRYDDEGITFVAGTGQTFDVRDFVSGAQRGDQFGQVDLGTSGDDTITPGIVQSAVNYYVNAGQGADTVTTAGGNDFLVGGVGNDTLSAFAGNDTLLGGAGDDALTGGTGADALVGGADTDRALVADAVTLAAFSLLADADPTTSGDQAGWRMVGATDGADSLSGVEIVDGTEAGRILLVGSGAFADEAAALAASTSTADQILIAGDRAINAVEDIPYTFGTRDFGFVDRDGVSDVGVRIATVPAASVGELRLNGVAVTAGQVIAANAIIAGNLTYLSALNVNGPTAFTFQLTDTVSGNVSAQTNSVAIAVAAVNDAPVIARPATATFNEDTTLAFTGGNAISIADVDVAGATVTVTLGIADGALALGTTTGLTVAGPVNSLTISGTLADVNAGLATLTYAPPLNANGARTLNIGVSDGGATGSGGTLTDAKSVAVTITAVNDAPVITRPATTVTLLEDATVAFTGGNAISIADVDVAGATVTVTLGIADGTLALGTTTGLTVTGPANSLTISGTLADVNAGLATLTYAPPANANGARTLNIGVSDGGATGSGGTLTDAKSVAIAITPVNDAPLFAATGAPASYTENALSIDVATGVTLSDIDNASFAGGSLTVTLSGLVTGDAIGLRATGAGGNGITFASGVVSFNGTAFATLTTANTTQLVFALNAQSDAANVAALTQAITFRSLSEDPTNAPRTYTYTLVDGGGTANAGVDSATFTRTIAVTPVDDLPVAVADTASTPENATVAITVLTNDTDVDAGPKDVVTIAGTTATVGTAIQLASGATATLNANGTITYNPNGRFNTLISTDKAAATGAGNSSATDSFGYALNGGSATTVTVTVTGVDSADDRIAGSAGNDSFNGTPGPDLYLFQAGGEDTANGSPGDDGAYLGAALSPGDTIALGAGAIDQLGLQGNYGTFGVGATPYTFSPNNIRMQAGQAGTEQIILLPGDDTRFGAPGNVSYSYNLALVDANIDAGQLLAINFNQLRPGETVRIDASAELNGAIVTYAGRGAETVIGSQSDDGFFNGAQGRFGPDSIYDGQGGSDTVGFAGLYTNAAGSPLAFTATQFTSIETFVFLSGGTTPFGSEGQPYAYDVTWNDGNFATGTVTIQANLLRSNEVLVFNGTAETTGSFAITAGAGNDVLIGGALADRINGGDGNNSFAGRGGADELTGGAGVNTYRYASTSDSAVGAADRVLAFKPGTDKIDLVLIDANTTNGVGTEDAFTFVSAAAFSDGGLAAGKLRAVQTAANQWTVEGDVNGDGVADFQILVTTTTATPLVASDFIL